MSDIFIAEVQTENGVVALYATKRVYERAVQTERAYTGLSDQTERCIALIRAAETAVQHKRTGFSLRCDDGSWTGRPQQIESECLALNLDVQADRIVVHDRSRQITASDPHYAAIAASALAALNSRGLRREA